MKTPLVAIAACALAAVPVLAAAGPHYTRSPDVKVKVERTEKTRPRTRDDAPPPPPPPSSGAEILALYGVLHTTVADKIVLLEQLLADTPEDQVDDRADLILRIAEAHSQQHLYWRLTAEQASIAGDDARATRAAKAAKQELLHAIKSYQQLTGDEAYRNFALRDRALFLQGYMQQAGRYFKAMRKSYAQLLKDHPDSAFIADANFALGDHAFERIEAHPDQKQELLLEAGRHYKAVLELPDGNVTEHARFKLGWVAINLGEFEEALGLFHQVLKATRGDSKQEVLHRAAAKDLVRAYAEVGNVERAWRYFKKIEKKLAFDMLERLAELYQEQGKAEKAIYTFRELMTLEPRHQRVCHWQYNVALGMLTAGDNAERVEEIEHLVGVYAAVKKKLKGEARDACHDDAAAMSGEMARSYHAEWAKTRDEKLLGHAERLYAVYLDGFPEADDRRDTLYWYAELLWLRAERDSTPARWETAAQAFGRCAGDQGNDQARREVCATAAVQGYVNADYADPARQKPPAIDDKIVAPDPQPVTARQQELLGAIAQFRALKKPNRDVLIEVKFLEAMVHYRSDRLDEAVPILVELVDQHREHERGVIAIDLLLHALNRLRRHDEMIGHVTRLLDDADLVAREPVLAERLRGLERTSRRKQAEACEERAGQGADPKAYVECAEIYLELFERDQEAADADALLWNAALDLERGRSIGSAIEIFDGLTRAYPKSVYAQKALVKLGDLYARIAWYREAAEKLEAYARKYAGEADAFGAMSDAVTFRKGIGDDAQAIADTRFFVKKFGKKDPAKAADAFFSMTSVLEKQGDRDEVVAHLRQYLKRHAAHGGLAREVAAWTKIGEQLWAKSCPVATVDGTCAKEVRVRAVRGKRARLRGRTQCDEQKVKLVTVARDGKLVKEATRAFKKAIAIYQKAKRKEEGALAPYASARFHLVEAKYEAYLAMRFPANLDFDPANPGRARKSMTRFNDWVADKSEAGKVAREGYEALVFEVKEPARAIASAARIAQIPQHFAHLMYTAEIPKNVRASEEAIDLYCAAVEEKTIPLEDKAITEFGNCLKASTRFNWFSEWSRLCERELGQIRPEEYPTASEVRPAATVISPLVTVEAPLARLP